MLYLWLSWSTNVYNFHRYSQKQVLFCLCTSASQLKLLLLSTQATVKCAFLKLVILLLYIYLGVGFRLSFMFVGGPRGKKVRNHCFNSFLLSRNQRVLHHQAVYKAMRILFVHKENKNNDFIQQFVSSVSPYPDSNQCWPRSGPHLARMDFTRDRCGPDLGYI